MNLLGIDLGSSSVKASLVNGENGETIASAFFPKEEMKIHAAKLGWAEQDPDLWMNSLISAVKEVMAVSKINPATIKAIGISYQMHGLIAIDKNRKLVRNAIIWCDSRAVEIGERAFNEIGMQECLSHSLNSPGNFTASKLKWVMENEPELYAKIDKIMLPGDYIAMRLTGEINTTISGLSEGILWDFKQNTSAKFLLDYFGINQALIPNVVDSFSVQGKLTEEAAQELGLEVGTPVSYRAGDQPNNALSLNVFEPGEIAATAGTSGVVYGISDALEFDKKSRVNSFAHVNHTVDAPRIGVLLCINGTGILNSWLKKEFVGELSYSQMNELGLLAPVGANGLTILPFGNGAERVLGNQQPGCIIENLNFNIHQKSHLIRAAHEGIAFSFFYGIQIMKQLGIEPKMIKAGKANMFQSPIFTSALASVSDAVIHLYDTDGAKGAAIAAGIGIGYYANREEAFSSLKQLSVIEPDVTNISTYHNAYEKWLNNLNKHI